MELAGVGTSEWFADTRSQKRELTRLIVQVKEGTEKRGAIESVVRLVRQTVRTLRMLRVYHFLQKPPLATQVDPTAPFTSQLQAESG